MAKAEEKEGAAPAPERRGIPVARIRFKGPQGGPRGNSGMVGEPSDLRNRRHAEASSTDRNTSKHEMEYQPWHRHHQVSYFGAGPDGPPTCVFYVHESSVAWWEPLAL